LASIAIKNKCDVEVIDSEAEGYNYVDIKGFIKAYKPDIVGMQTYCTNIQQCLKVAQIIKSINPYIKVLLGGAQVTLFYDKDYDNVDFYHAGMCITDQENKREFSFKGTKGYEEYPQFLNDLDLDIAIAPIKDTAFNRSKSNIKVVKNMEC